MVFRAMHGSRADAPSARTARKDDEFVAYDAMVLAQGAGKDGFINQRVQTDIVKALKAIRTAHPEVQSIHARPGSAMDSLLLFLKPEGEKIIKQKVKTPENFHGETSIVGGTGIRQLDKLNAKYGAKSVTTFLSTDALLVTFKRPMDIPVVSRIYAAVPEVGGAEADLAMGDGDEIYLQQNTHEWLFAFKHGWGDCPAGCIHNHYDFFTYNPADQTVVKTGEHDGRFPDAEAMWKKVKGVHAESKP